MAEVVLDKVTKVYGETLAVRDVDLQIEDGEFVVFVGPSGCGKSTTLRMIAGLESITGGTLRIGDRVVNRVAPRDRDVAMVFQSYALYPHMTVFENMAFGLRVRGTPKAEVTERVGRVADVLQLTDYLARRPKALSGGQRQRVAMGRAMVRDPAVFLFDEPLSNLDAKLRVQMRLELKRLHRRLGATTVYVTHDQVEAMTLADRIVVMSMGEVQQVGSPLDIYERPANRFVAGFIGSPAMNFLDVEAASTPSGVRLRGPGLDLPAPAGATAGSAYVVGLRPQDLFYEGPSSATAATAGGSAAAAPAIDLTVELVEHMGAESFAHARLAGAPVVFGVEPRVGHGLEGQTVAVPIPLPRVHVFDPAGDAVADAPR